MFRKIYDALLASTFAVSCIALGWMLHEVVK